MSGLNTFDAPGAGCDVPSPVSTCGTPSGCAAEGGVGAAGAAGGWAAASAASSALSRSRYSFCAASKSARSLSICSRSACWLSGFCAAATAGTPATVSASAPTRPARTTQILIPIPSTLTLVGSPFRRPPRAGSSRPLRTRWGARQRDRERRTLPETAVDRDRPVMTIDDPFDQAQSEPDAFVGCRPRRVSLIEAFERVPGFLRRHADAVVAHVDAGATAFLRDSQHDASTFARELHRVVQQVEQQSLQPSGVAIHHHRAR